MQMLSRRRLLFAMVPAFAGLVIAATAGCGNQDKAEIEKAYAGLDTALNAKDAAKFAGFYSDKLALKGPQGQTINKAMVQQGMGQLFAVAQSVEAKTTVEEVKAEGETATAKIKTHLSVKINNPLTGKPAAIVADSEKNDSWAKESGAWKITGSQTLSSSGTIDGKPLPANMPGVGAL